jgi:hypothetical protein
MIYVSIKIIFINYANMIYLFIGMICVILGFVYNEAKMG